jgi:hypothetical protein
MVLEKSDRFISNIETVRLELNRGSYRAHCGKEENSSCSNLHSEGFGIIE